MMMDKYQILQNDEIELVVIGCGGSGGWFIQNLDKLYELELDYNYPFYPKITQIRLYDGDIVEKKNVERQNFLETDIGSYKVDACVNKMNIDISSYNHGEYEGFINKYPVKIITVNKYINKQTLRDFTFYKKATIFVTFVDNVKTRLEMNNFLWNSYLNFIHIDVGNNRGNGQLYNSFRFGDIKSKKLQDKYPHLEEMKDEEEGLSCAELSQQVKQILPVNYMAGQIALQYIAYLFNRLIFSERSFGSKIKGSEIITELEFNLIPSIKVVDSVII